MKRIWPGTRSRHATEAEVRAARKALGQLENERLSVILVPAPDQRFDGHCIRAVEMRNPKWYREFVSGRWDTVKRCRVERALRRVAEGSFIRGNGYEAGLLKFLESWD